MKIKNRSEQDSMSGGKNIKKKIGAVKRKSVPFLVVILVVTSALCYGQTSDCPSCIVGYWKMDESSGALAHDSINGNHGGVFTDGDGMDPVWAPGIAGNALDFAGDAPDAVVIGDDPAYHFGTGDFALEAWIKYEGPTDGSVMYPAIMSKRPGPPGSDPIGGFCLCLSYWEGGTLGGLLMRIEDTNYVPYSLSGSLSLLDDGEWHHVVVQRCQDQVQFYVDGLLDGTATSTKDATTDAGLTLGLDLKSSYDTEWEGLIDEVALYDCCLSPETISLHYECGLNGEGYCCWGEWGNVTVTWTSPSGPRSWTGSCGDDFGIGSILPESSIGINTSITCEPSPPCPEPNYEWEVTNFGGPPFYDSGTTLPFSFTPTATEGAFEVKVSASCGDSLCTPCTIIVNPVVKCMDITKKIVDPDTGELVDNIEVPVDTEVDFKVTVCNCGTSDRENIKVVDYFLDCLEYLDSEASEAIDDISISGNQVVWVFSSLTLHPGDCFDIKVKAKVVSEGDCENCVKVFAESQGESISDEDCVAVTANENGGICLGSALMGIFVFGAVVLNRKKE